MTLPRSRGAALAASATLVLATLVGCGSDAARDPGADPPSLGASPSNSASNSAAPTATLSAEPSGTASASPTADAPSEHTIAIYFTGATGLGPRLYREFQKVTTNDPLLTGVQRLLAGEAIDPDYSSLLPAATVDAVSFDEAAKTITVATSDPTLTDRPADMSEADAEIAAQSLVYTVQAIAGARARVVLELNGVPSTLVGINTADGLTNAPELDVRALVNITTPEQGQTVSGSFVAEGVASSFEASVGWEIRRGDEVVRTNGTQAEGWLEKLYPWKTKVSVKGLPPGEYVFAAFTDDPTGGTEGPGPTYDTKAITIK